jgi:hypothetical protein
MAQFGLKCSRPIMMSVGNGTSAGSTQEIYFTAGANGYQDGRHGSLVIPLVSVSVCALCNVQFNYTGERLQPSGLRRFLRGSDFISRETIVGGKSSALRMPPDGGMQLPHASASSEGVRR